MRFHSRPGYGGAFFTTVVYRSLLILSKVFVILRPAGEARRTPQLKNRLGNIGLQAIFLKKWNFI